MPLRTPGRPPVSHIKYLILVDKVCENLSQHYKLVSSPNGGTEHHSGRANGRKMSFLVKLATKMAPVSPWRPPVDDIKYLKLIGEVGGNLSQH